MLDPDHTPWALRGQRAVGMREVGRAEFLVSRESPALPGGGAMLSISQCSPVGTGTRESQSFQFVRESPDFEKLVPKFLT